VIANSMGGDFALSTRREKAVEPRHRFGGGDSHDQAAPVAKARPDLPQLPSLELPLYEIKPKSTVRPKPRKKPTKKLLD
jgi:hypothetical protein